MIWISYEYDNKVIAKKANAFKIGLQEVNWRTLWHEDKEDNIEGGHGVIVTPTFARSRIITLEWIIIWNDKNSVAQAMDYLDKLFALQDDFFELKEKLFIVLDERWNYWKINAKIKEPVNYILLNNDYENRANRKFRVVLEAQDPRFFSLRENHKYWSEGVCGGQNLWIKLAAALNKKINTINCVSHWNQSSPVKMEIIVNKNSKINAPFTIKDLSKWKFFSLNLDANFGDKIVIDSKNRKVTKNGKDALYSRIEWSNFPYIKGETVFVISDIDWGLYSSDFDVNIYYYDILL